MLNSTYSNQVINVLSTVDVKRNVGRWFATGKDYET